MRKFKCLLLLAFIGLTTSAFAQNDYTGYNRIYVGYTGVNAKWSADGESVSQKFPGFSVGYLRGISLTQKVPLYLEVAGALQYNKWSEEGESEKIFGLNIPVSLLYRFNITDDFSISPNFGLNFRLNLTGKYEVDGVDESLNLFDDDEMGGEGWKRFQAGWHIGANFDYKFLHLGVNWGTDFNEITADTNCRTTSVTVGWNF